MDLFFLFFEFWFNKMRNISVCDKRLKNCIAFRHNKHTYLYVLPYLFIHLFIFLYIYLPIYLYISISTLFRYTWIIRISEIYFEWIHKNIWKRNSDFHIYIFWFKSIAKREKKIFRSDLNSIQKCIPVQY